MKIESEAIVRMICKLGMWLNKIWLIVSITYWIFIFKMNWIEYSLLQSMINQAVFDLIWFSSWWPGHELFLTLYGCPRFVGRCLSNALFTRFRNQSNAVFGCMLVSRPISIGFHCAPSIALCIDASTFSFPRNLPKLFGTFS